MFVKNQAITGFPFELLDNVGDPITTGTVTGYYTLDGGVQTALTGTATHEGNGQWTWGTIPAAATNGDLLGLLFLHDDGRASFPCDIADSHLLVDPTVLADGLRANRRGKAVLDEEPGTDLRGSNIEGRAPVVEEAEHIHEGLGCRVALAEPVVVQVPEFG